MAEHSTVDELPSIDEFIADTTDESTQPEGVDVVEASDEPAGDDWALGDAGASISSLAQDLTSMTPPSTAASGAAAHAPWQDDEAWMDIMPTIPQAPAPDALIDTSWARAFAEPPAPLATPTQTPPPLPAGDAQAAALSLEAVARRLRAGELSVPGFSAGASDAAALAAALASLLASID
jgi:hypothetical protein